MSQSAAHAYENAPRALTTFSDEENLFRQSVREFAEQQIRPLVHDMDEEGKFSPELLQQFFDLGLMGIGIPEEYGGQGGTFFNSIIAVEEFSRVDPSAGVIIDVQNTLVNNAILLWGTEEQKKTYGARLATDTVGAYALSEAASGSDAFGLTTRAEDKGDHYALSGQKLWITNGGEAGIFIVFATVDATKGYRGITAFLVEREFSGFTVGKKENKLGIRASSTCELLMDNCIVPKENVLGEVGKGYKIAIETLNEGRIGIGSQMVGLSQGALEYGINYTKERQQFGQPIAKFQGVQFQVAQIATELEAARLMVYNAARLKDSGESYVKEAAMAKLFSSQVAEHVTSQVVELYGGYGYTKDYPAEKYYRDAKIGKIYEGTSNMQLQTIAKLILGDV